MLHASVDKPFGIRDKSVAFVSLWLSWIRLQSSGRSDVAMTMEAGFQISGGFLPVYLPHAESFQIRSLIQCVTE